MSHVANAFITFYENFPVRLVSAYENKVLHDPDTSSIYFDLVRKYDNTSFTRFVEYVLEIATLHNCFERYSFCGINVHFR